MKQTDKDELKKAKALLTQATVVLNKYGHANSVEKLINEIDQLIFPVLEKK